MKPGDIFNIAFENKLRTGIIKRVLYDGKLEEDELFIVETQNGNIVMRSRVRTDTSWIIVSGCEDAARKLDVQRALHVRALRELDWFKYVAKAV